MRKCMRKGKASCEATSMEVTVTPLGACTRARALMLQKKCTQKGEDDGREYLELRNRRLERISPQKLAARRGGRRKMVVEEGTKASFKENMFKMGDIARRDRETTPCNLIMDSNTIPSLGSATRPNHSNYHGNAQTLICSNDPDLVKFNDSFTAKVRQDQQAFADKYNFDPVNDCPLSGRFEWVKLK